jgi:hypothetical protein
MTTRTIGHGWSVELPGEFHERVDEGQRVFWHHGRTVYATVYPTTGGEAEAALAAMVGERGEKPVRRYQRREPSGVKGEAWLMPEEDGEYWGLNTWTEMAGSVACVTFYFETEADVGWALRAWESVAPAGAAVLQNGTSPQDVAGRGVMN